jgi:hypothetical protein
MCSPGCPQLWGDGRGKSVDASDWFQESSVAALRSEKSSPVSANPVASSQMVIGSVRSSPGPSALVLVGAESRTFRNAVAGGILFRVARSRCPDSAAGPYEYEWDKRRNAEAFVGPCSSGTRGNRPKPSVPVRTFCIARGEFVSRCEVRISFFRREMGF